jgi:hypothetical protein
MIVLSLASAVLLLSWATEAFVPSVCQSTSRRGVPGQQPQDRPLFLSQEGSDEGVSNVDKPSFEEGSHDELVYALGVNLARQLGDIRPLVENGEELASVAKGLLDTVIGRLTDDGQRELLQRRGTELNKLITDRA